MVPAMRRPAAIALTTSAVVIEPHGLLHARTKASVVGADRGLEFASGQSS
jgi:hypothetical protein